MTTSTKKSAPSAIVKAENNQLAMHDLLDFAIPAKVRSQGYPALQTSTYRPGMDSVVSWVMSPESAGFLSEAARELLEMTEVVCEYDDPTVMLKIGISSDRLRFAILGQPEKFTQHKETKAIDYLRKGVSFKKSNVVSASKLVMVLILDGHPILDNNDVPQIVTLKLTSTKVTMIESRDSSDITLSTLNIDLCRQLKSSGIWLLHLASVGIVPGVRKLSSATDPKLSSVSVVYKLDPGIEILDRVYLPAIFALAQTQDVIDYIANPFGIEGQDGQFVNAFAIEATVEEGFGF